MKYLCECGELINITGRIPDPNQWLFINDVDYEALSNKSGYRQIYRAMSFFYKCEGCGRLWFWWGDDEKPTVYKLDEE